MASAESKGLTLAELTSLLEAENRTPSVSLSGCITCGFACDVLSDVLSHGRKGMAWVTVRSHITVAAVAVMTEAACVILAQGYLPEESLAERAAREGIPVLCTPLTEYEVCGRLFAAGIPSV